jgi:hypothetical protein
MYQKPLLLACFLWLYFTAPAQDGAKKDTLLFKITTQPP